MFKSYFYKFSRLFLCSNNIRSYSTSVANNSPNANPISIELFYFALRGRAEQIRLLLNEANLNYTDRLLTQAQLRKLKAAGSPISNSDYLSAQLASSLPFGGIPLLVHNSLNLAQTPAILYYLANLKPEENLFPKDLIEQSKAQMVIAGTEDLFQAYWPIKLDQNKYMYHSGAFPLSPGTNDDYRQFPSNYLAQPFHHYSVPRSFRREVLPRWLTYFEALIANNTSSTGYIVGKERSYADIVLFAHINQVLTIEPECLASFPSLAAHYHLISKRPRIAQYINTRPNSGL
jgi:glutathione S-transferase